MKMENKSFGLALVIGVCALGGGPALASPLQFPISKATGVIVKEVRCKSGLVVTDKLLTKQEIAERIAKDGRATKIIGQLLIRFRSPEDEWGETFFALRLVSVMPNATVVDEYELTYSMELFSDKDAKRTIRVLPYPNPMDLDADDIQMTKYESCYISKTALVPTLEKEMTVGELRALLKIEIAAAADAHENGSAPSEVTRPSVAPKQKQTPTEGSGSSGQPPRVH